MKGLWFLTITVYQIVNMDDYSVYGIMAFSLPVQPAEAAENQVRTCPQ